MQKDEPDSKKEVLLFEQRGETSRFISVRINENGDLIFSGQDAGKEPLKWFDDLDYEFWVTVKVEEKDRLLIALIQKQFSGDFSAVDKFREFLKERGVPFHWNVW